jgi:hypothetical protein
MLGNFFRRNEYGIFSEFSDGFTVPFRKIESEQEVAAKICEGEILSKPDSCPDAVYEKLKSCWVFEPEKRITFKELEKFFHELLGNVETMNMEANTLLSPNLETRQEMIPEDMSERSQYGEAIPAECS